MAFSTKYHYVLEGVQHDAIGNLTAIAYTSEVPADVSACQVIQYVTVLALHRA